MFTIPPHDGHMLALAVAAAIVPGVPPADTGILAIGDFGVGGTVERQTGAAVRRFAANRPADVLVTVGDNDYTERPRAFRRNWRASFGWASAEGLDVLGTLGNHDVRVAGGRYEFQLLGMPQRYYRRRIGDVAFFLLDSNHVGRTQTTWLARALRASRAPWKIVAMHHPAFTCGGYVGNPAVRRRWVPLFERHGVDLVLAGHDHNYQRFAARRGVRYVVHGGGGARLYQPNGCPAGYPPRREARAMRGWVYIRANERSLRVRAIDPGGRVRDAFTVYP
jgi:3',5'-cyclic AMP phosphodiesterase CpdA